MLALKKAYLFTFSLLLIVSLLSGSNALHLSALEVSADSAILIDGKSGTVLYEKNAEQIRPMASTTKIMTALIAIESGNLDRTVRIPKDAMGIEGSSVYLCEGEELTLRQLLYALLLSSANDAAVAIAIDIGGSVENFASLMNQRAIALGLSDTHFDNPHGLDSDAHYTTAKDLATLAAYAMSLPEFRNIVSTYKQTIPMNNGENTRLTVNHNKLLRSYKGAVGVKTGFTKKSGRCLVSAAERDGTLLIAVTLSALNDWSDHTSMLDYGFERYETVKLTDGMINFYIPVVSGQSSSVLCGYVQDISVLLPRSRGNVICRIETERFLYAPVEKSEAVGNVTFFCDGKEVGKAEIVSLERVELSPQRLSLWDKIKIFFGIY